MKKTKKVAQIFREKDKHVVKNQEKKENNF